jgi:hypothetical protein
VKNIAPIQAITTAAQRMNVCSGQTVRMAITTMSRTTKAIYFVPNLLATSEFLTNDGFAFLTGIISEL